MPSRKTVWSLFKNPQVLIGLILSIGGIYLAFHDFDFVEFQNALTKVNYLYVGFAMAILLFATWIRSIRWRYLLIHEKDISVYTLFRAEIIGYWGNSILPLRMGELLRSYLLTREEKISGTVVLGSIVLERLLDTIGLMCLVILLTLSYPLEADIQTKLRLGILIIIAGSIVLALLLFQLSKTSSTNKFIELARKFFSSFSVLKGRYRWQTMVITICLWLCYWLGVLVISKSMSLGLSVVQCLLIIVLSSLAYSIPSAPGTIGTYHAAVKYTLVTLIGGFTASTAINFAVILHAYSYLLFVGLGTYYFLNSQFHAGAITSLVEKSEEKK